MDKLDVKINAKSAYSYPIFIGENLINNVYKLISDYTKAKRYLIVTNETVYPIIGKKLASNNSEFIILPDGEIYKNMETLIQITDKALEMKLERNDAIIALGGGVIGDMAGFSASIYRRGIDFIQIPTTLLAQVDSSVGGKVAVNHTSGKNMLGAFYQPQAVISDTSVLKTLDERQYKTGLGEVLKYAFIEHTCSAGKDFNFLEFLENNQNNILKREDKTLCELIKICCTLKSAVVNADEKEKGLRAILNLGHTYAHAIENLTNYKKYTHGEAVSIGIKMVFDLALKLNTVTKNYYDRAVNLLKSYGLLIKTDEVFDKEMFYHVMQGDKKVTEGKLKIVLPNGEKSVEITDNIDKKIILSGI